MSALGGWVPPELRAKPRPVLGCLALVLAVLVACVFGVAYVARLGWGAAS